MSFGRKGLAPGQAVPAGPVGFGRAQAQAPAPALAQAPEAQNSAEFDDIAAKREAFIAAERARQAEARAVEIGEGSLPSSPQTIDALRNSARPAQPLGAGQIGASGLPLHQEEQIRAAAQSYSSGAASAPRSYSGGSGGKSYFFGDPHGRSLGIAYLIWFVIGQTGLHRVYCGSKDSAIIQVSLLVVSVVCMLIFPPLGIIGFLAWFCWIIGDLFMMPGMLRRFKEAHDYSREFE